MAVTPATIKAMFPEFANKEDSYIQIYIDAAKLMLCSSLYGSKYDLALSYLTAHLMQLSDNGGNSSSNKTVGSVSVGYTTPSDLTGYSSTGYGRTFETIRKSVVSMTLRPIYGTGSRC